MENGKIEIVMEAPIGYVYRSRDLVDQVDSFIENQKSYGKACGPQEIFARDYLIAVTNGVSHAPHCGVFLRSGEDIPCHAVAGPDPLGNWAGITDDGKVHEWFADEVW